MTPSPNAINRYRLEPMITDGLIAPPIEIPLPELLRGVMGTQYLKEEYRVGPASDWAFGMLDHHREKTDLLGLWAPADNKACGLHYVVDDKRIKLDYVQTPADGDSQSAKQALGTQPHELLVAHFIRRLAPVLNARPDTEVVLEDRIHSLTEDIQGAETVHESSKLIPQLRIYTGLRDRFFDSELNLSPARSRVRELLGENNAWLKKRR